MNYFIIHAPLCDYLYPVHKPQQHIMNSLNHYATCAWQVSFPAPYAYLLTSSIGSLSGGSSSWYVPRPPPGRQDTCVCTPCTAHTLYMLMNAAPHCTCAASIQAPECPLTCLPTSCCCPAAPAPYLITLLPCPLRHSALQPRTGVLQQPHGKRNKHPHIGLLCQGCVCSR